MRIGLYSGITTIGIIVAAGLYMAFFRPPPPVWYEENFPRIPPRHYAERCGHDLPNWELAEDKDCYKRVAEKAIKADALRVGEAMKALEAKDCPSYFALMGTSTAAVETQLPRLAARLYFDGVCVPHTPQRAVEIWEEHASSVRNQWEALARLSTVYWQGLYRDEDKPLALALAKEAAATAYFNYLEGTNDVPVDFRIIFRERASDFYDGVLGNSTMDRLLSFQSIGAQPWHLPPPLLEQQDWLRRALADENGELFLQTAKEFHQQELDDYLAGRMLHHAVYDKKNAEAAFAYYTWLKPEWEAKISNERSDEYTSFYAREALKYLEHAAELGHIEGIKEYYRILKSTKDMTGNDQSLWDNGLNRALYDMARLNLPIEKEDETRQKQILSDLQKRKNEIVDFAAQEFPNNSDKQNEIIRLHLEMDNYIIGHYTYTLYTISINW